jgi:hypothetical protein
MSAGRESVDARAGAKSRCAESKQEWPSVTDRSETQTQASGQTKRMARERMKEENAEIAVMPETLWCRVAEVVVFGQIDQQQMA